MLRFYMCRMSDAKKHPTYEGEKIVTKIN
jgi:hypothetical protein